jgi:hypothetical protein
VEKCNVDASFLVDNKKGSWGRSFKIILEILFCLLGELYKIAKVLEWKKLLRAWKVLNWVLLIAL